MTVRGYLYQFSRQLSQTAGLTSEDYLNTKDLLTDGGMMFGAVSPDIWGKGTTRTTAAAIMGHIMSRTIPFGKLCEYITVDEIRKGIPNLSISSAGCSEPTIRRVLHVLAEEGYIFRLVTNAGRSVMYGLMLPKIQQVLATLFNKATPKEGTSGAIQKERFERFTAICSMLSRWYDEVMSIKDCRLGNLRTILSEVGRVSAYHEST